MSVNSNPNIQAILGRISQIQQKLNSLGLSPAESSGEGFGDILANELNTSEKQDIIALIDDEAKETGVDANLLKAVAQTESGFDPSAVSGAGALGVMQLMPQTAQSLGVKNALNAKESIDGGAHYLKDLLNKYHDVPKALAAYNAGPGSVDSFGGIPPYAETQRYVKKVMSAYKQFSGQSIQQGGQ